MGDEPAARYVVADADDGCQVVDQQTGEPVVHVSERWLAESWAAELNRHARLREHSDNER